MLFLRTYLLVDADAVAADEDAVGSCHCRKAAVATPCSLWSAHKGISNGGDSNAEKRAKQQSESNNNNNSMKQENSNNNSKKAIASRKFTHPQKMFATRALHISALRLSVVFLWCLGRNAQPALVGYAPARSSSCSFCYCCRHYYLLPPLPLRQNNTYTQLARSKPCDIIAVRAT